MASEVAALSSVAETIRDRIKRDFIGLIPDEMWDNLVGETVKQFTTVQRTHDGLQLSPLQRIVYDELTATTKARINEAIEKGAVIRFDKDGAEMLNDVLGTVIKENTGLVVNRAAEMMLQQLLQQVLSVMRNNSTFR